jgi:antitoxin component of MazEF toxin-antitoxin module
MPITKQLLPSGGSKAVVLPKPFLDQLDLTEETATVDIALKGDAIVITKHRYATAPEFEASKSRVLTKHAGLMKRLAKR